MTLNAVVGRRCSLPLRPRRAASIFSVTRQTAAAKKRRRFIAMKLDVRVVARNTAQPAIAAGPATAHLHLLKLIERHEMVSLDRLRDRKYRRHISQRRSRPEVEIILARLKHPGVAGKMALRADIVANPVLQLPRIHYGKIDRSFFDRPSRACLLSVLPHMSSARPMTALTPNSQKAKGRLLKLVVTSHN